MIEFCCIEVKKIFQIAVLLLAIVTGSVHQLAAQEPPSLTRVFIDCPACDAEYLRQELTFVDLVRDRLLASVTAMVTSLPTGAGGTAYTIEVLGTLRDRRVADTAIVNVAPDATEIERRQAVVRAIKIALIPFIRGTISSAHLDLTYTPPESRVSRKRDHDPWRQWVFHVSGSGSFGSDDNYSSRGGQGSIGSSRVTDALKIDLAAKGAFNREKYHLDDGEMVTSDRKSWSVKTLSVWSLGNHYSLGLSANAGSSSFENTSFQFRAMPSVEFDLFPYRDATRRQLVLRYGLGIRTARYVDTTIYHLTAESRPVHELLAVSDIRQPWGAVWGKAVWSQYLHDLSKRRLSLDAGLDWRIVAGLSVNVGIYYSLIRDQLNIPGTNLSNEERLLRLREIQSGYSASGGIGLSYTFGSVFSSIVNSRFRL